MAIGRLAWRTPTGAMLWEIWGRNKVNFLWQTAALAAGFFFVWCKKHGASQDISDNWNAAAVGCFLLASLHRLICFGYFEVDARTMQLSFPRQLLFKPVSTARLVLMPMFFGGIIIVTTFLIWTELVLRISFTTSDLLLISAVQLSFFWWIQALAWGFPLPKGRLLVLVIMAIIHFLVWRLPQLPINALAKWQWPILFALLVSAPSFAWMGLKLMRQGKWEGPSGISKFWSRRYFAPAQGRRQPFRSAFAAQFWLEWRRLGLLLPAISGGMACLIIATAFIFRKIAGTSGQSGGPDIELASVIMGLIQLTLAVPLIVSVLLAPLMAGFNRLHSAGGELPVYIAVRPMSNGGFVLAKMAMALATSALAWLVMAVACFCLAFMEKDAFFSRAGLVTPFGPVSYLTGCLPVLLLLVIWTWRNLMGMGAGLTGRTWMVGAFYLSTIYVFYFGLFLLEQTARSNVNFRETLLRWLTAILIVRLAVKIVTSIIAFVLGLRRNAITLPAVGWIVGGWLVCGLFVAGYASQVCNALNQPDLRLWLSLGAFLFLPLTDLAIAPLALAWNRHR